jgi:inosose dehydratase
MIRIANAPCSWGVLEFDLDGNVAGYVQVLSEMKETGYAGTELGDWGFMPTDPRKLKSELSAYGLKLLGAFVPVNLSDANAHEPGMGVAVRTAKLLAAVTDDLPFIVLADDNGKDPIRSQNAGRIKPEHALSEKNWQIFAHGAEKVAEAVLQQTGVRTVFHHHCAGYVETPAEVDKLLSLTDPELLGLCFDTGHYAFGGGDPAAGVRKYADRIWHFHFKDHSPDIGLQARADEWDYFSSVQHGIFCELGKGDVDFPAVILALENAGYDGWGVVEQDVLPGMGSPKESARRNREYLREIGL